jgi:hypothetical protein
MTFFCIYVLGLVFVYTSPRTEHMGLATLGFATALCMTLTTYNVHRLGRFDLIGIALVASFALLLSSLVMILLFYDRKNTDGKDIVGTPSYLPGLGRDIITLFETIFIAIFVFLTLLQVLFLRNAYSPSAQKVSSGVPLITKLLFSLVNGGKLLSEDEQDQRSYVLTATPFAFITLALTSYTVYLTNVLQYIK